MHVLARHPHPSPLSPLVSRRAGTCTKLSRVRETQQSGVHSGLDFQDGPHTRHHSLTACFQPATSGDKSSNAAARTPPFVRRRRRAPPTVKYAAALPARRKAATPHTHTHTPTVTRTEASRAATPSHASSMRFYSPLAMCGVAAFSLCHARLLSFKTSRGRGAAGSLTFSQVCAVRFLCASFYGLRSTPTPTHFQRITTPACAANPVRLSAAKRPRP